MFGRILPGSLRNWEVLIGRAFPGHRHSPQDFMNRPRVLCCAPSLNCSPSNMYLGSTAKGPSMANPWSSSSSTQNPLGSGWRLGKFWQSCSFGVSEGTPYPHPSAIRIMGIGFNGCSGTHAHFYHCSHVQESSSRHPTRKTVDPRSPHQEV